jgi:hypothetical protein
MVAFQVVTHMLGPALISVFGGHPPLSEGIGHGENHVRYVDRDVIFINTKYTGLNRTGK